MVSRLSNYKQSKNLLHHLHGNYIATNLRIQLPLQAGGAGEGREDGEADGPRVQYKDMISLDPLINFEIF